MALIADMRDLGNSHKLNARSIAEVTGEMERVVARFGETRSVTFRGRKLSNEAFLNAAVLHLIGLDADEQERALADGVARLESLLLDDADGGLKVRGSGGDEPGPVGLAREPRTKPAPRRRRNEG